MHATSPHTNTTTVTTATHANAAAHWLTTVTHCPPIRSILWSGERIELQPAELDERSVCRKFLALSLDPLNGECLAGERALQTAQPRACVADTSAPASSPLTLANRHLSPLTVPRQGHSWYTARTRLR